MNRIIVTLSGGKSSAWCALWAAKNFPNNSIVLYFNDTKWEHPDLYRFINDISKILQIPITVDSDGRTPEQLFIDNNALANNRMPFCSRILKAERLQRFYMDGDTIVFGIGLDEQHRALRITQVYQKVAAKTGKFPTLLFPLLSTQTTKQQIDDDFKDLGIVEPYLYKLGFSHNNCSGGCVRAGKKQWRLLLEKLPDVYADRERVEESIRKLTHKDISFFKDETLGSFRARIEQKNMDIADEKDAGYLGECIGICETES